MTTELAFPAAPEGRVSGSVQGQRSFMAAAEFPLRVARYQLVYESGGAGPHRGGDGIERVVRALQRGDVVAFRTPGGGWGHPESCSRTEHEHEREEL